MQSTALQLQIKHQLKHLPREIVQIDLISDLQQKSHVINATKSTEQ